MSLKDLFTSMSQAPENFLPSEFVPAKKILCVRVISLLHFPQRLRLKTQRSQIKWPQSSTTRVAADLLHDLHSIMDTISSFSCCSRSISIIKILARVLHSCIFNDVVYLCGRVKETFAFMKNYITTDIWRLRGCKY